MATVAVLTADVVGSTRYGHVDRQALHAILSSAFRATEQRFPDAWTTGFALRVTAGDEFQGVVSAVGSVVGVLVYLRSILALSGLSSIPELRAGIGIGDVTVSGGSSSWEQDGPAFVRARRALESLGASRREWRRTAICSGDWYRDDAHAAVLGLCDRFQQRWTRQQWEAVHHTIGGAKTEEVGRRLGIARQNVTKRLRAAGWPAFDAAMTFLARSLTQAEPPARATLSAAGRRGPR
jgi:hypothetical protein